MNAGYRPGEKRVEQSAGPGGQALVIGRPWGKKELADALRMTPRQVQNWLDDESLPEINGDALLTLERVFFGSNQRYMRDIRIELRRALDRSHQIRRSSKPDRPAPSTLNSDWDKNHKRLTGLLDAPVPGDSVPSSRIYVSIRARHEETWDRLPAQYRNEETRDQDGYRRKLTSIAVDLEASLLEWLYGEIESFDAVRLIRSGPGGGKSTAARHLAKTVIERIGEWKVGYPGVSYVLFIPLQHLDAGQRDLPTSLSAYLTGIAGFQLSPLSNPSMFRRTSRLLIILDGLDEIGPATEANLEALRLVTSLQKWLGAVNAEETRITAAVFGRDASMQHVGRHTPLAPHQTLQLLPYRVRDPTIRGQQELISADQRYVWWRLWAKAKSLSTDPPRALNVPALSELTDDPLQLFLLASTGAYADERVLEGRRTDFFHLVRDRVITNWHNRVGRVAAEFGPNDSIVRLLEAVAIAAWRDGGRVTTIGKILEYCGEDTTLTAALGRLVESQDIGRAMLMFYTRAKAPLEGGDGVEFTHKSLCDFMIACTLARRTLIAIRQVGAGSPITFDAWADLFADGQMSDEIAHLTRNEIERAFKGFDGSPSIGPLWSGVMNTLPASWANAREHGWGRDETAIAMLAFVRSLFFKKYLLEPVWIHAETPRVVIGRISQLASSSEWYWRYPYRSFVPKVANSWVRQLHHVDFSAQQLFSMSFIQLDLFGCSFDRANLSASRFVDCILCSVQFKGADLRGTTWDGTNVSGANFAGADIRGADFRFANGLVAHQFEAATRDSTTLLPYLGRDWR
ncbi:NACHT domain-containing protein [Prosthecomicrobium hirschii]|uniref:NACHT domain-containing protein n=1 Tax=Prosthecodimorpha hirschii TaxID=665126 RepID=UPI001364C341|nr:pentapeptide repeat-containing protein [Prosthecomicrobium hirschii]